MTSGPARRRSALGLHLLGVVAVPACLLAGLFELRRAQGGNQLSWAYVVEWPLIAGYGVYLWVRLARERRDGAQPAPARDPDPPGAAVDEPADADLRAWQAYLAEFETRNPPGGPGRTA